MPVERLTDKGLYHGLAAHIEPFSGSVQFLQHCGGEIHIHALNGLNHAAPALEETSYVFPLIG
jgi:hypothetical protein